MQEAIVVLDDMMSLLMVEQIDSEAYYSETATAPTTPSLDSYTNSKPGSPGPNSSKDASSTNGASSRKPSSSAFQTTSNRIANTTRELYGLGS